MTETQEEPKTSLHEPTLTGIGGWLLFYVMTSAVGSLLSAILLTRPEFQTWLIFRLLVIVIQIVPVILILMKNRLAIYAVAFDLVVSTAHAIFSWVRFRLPGHDLLNGTTSVAAVLAVNIAWYFYFKTSRRVRYTLGSNLR